MPNTTTSQAERVKITRYIEQPVKPGAVSRMQIDKEGPWVQYDQHQQALAEAERRVFEYLSVVGLIGPSMGTMSTVGGIMEKEQNNKVTAGKLEFEIVTDEYKRPKTPVRLAIEDDRVCLIARDEKGCWWHIVSLLDDGTVLRNRSIPSSLGFQLDRAGRIVTKDK